MTLLPESSDGGLALETILDLLGSRMWRSRARLDFDIVARVRVYSTHRLFITYQSLGH